MATGRSPPVTDWITERRELIAEAPPRPWQVVEDDDWYAGIVDALGQETADARTGPALVHSWVARLAVRAVNDYEALLDVADRGRELKLWEPGRKDWAVAFRRFTDALARLEERE